MLLTIGLQQPFDVPHSTFASIHILFDETTTFGFPYALAGTSQYDLTS